MSKITRRHTYQVGDKLEFLGRFGRRMHPTNLKPDEFKEGRAFQLIAIEPETVLGSTPILINKYNNIVIGGNFPVVLNYDEHKYSTQEQIKMSQTNKEPLYYISATITEVGGSFEFRASLSYCQQYVDLDDSHSQKRFLSRILTDLQLENLFNVFDKPIKLLQERTEKNKQKLMQVKGIKEVMVEKLYNKWEDNVEDALINKELEEFGFSPLIIDKVKNHFKDISKGIELIKQNPYILTNIKGIGFKKADKYADRIGIKYDSPLRIKSYIKHFLNIEANDGKSFLKTTELIDIVTYDLELYINGEDEEEVAKADEMAISCIKELIEDETLWSGGSGLIGLKYIHDLEEDVSIELKRLVNARANIPPSRDIDEFIKTQQQAQGFIYTDKQSQSIKDAQNHNVILVTGLSGTGKSSTAEGAIRSFNAVNPLAVALAGRAVYRLSELTDNIETSTIHRALEPTMDDNGNFVFKRNRYEPMDNDVYIVDEYTMLSLPLFLKFLKAIPTGSRLIILGDYHQLDSMFSGNLAMDLLNSKLIYTVNLDKIHRQAEKSAITVKSKDIANGKQIFDDEYEGKETYGELADLTLDIVEQESTPKSTLDRMLEQYKYYSNVCEAEPHEISCILPTKKSVLFMNNMIQDYVNNPDDKEKKIVIDSDENGVYWLTENDIIMATKNNYMVEEVYKENAVNSWILNINKSQVVNFADSFKTAKKAERRKIINRLNQIPDNFEREDYDNLYNGTKLDLVEIKVDDKNNPTAMIVYDEINDQHYRLYPQYFKYNMKLAYAVTCHKFQGSEIDYAVVGMDYTHYKLLNRNWLYTALTRAKVKCSLVGENEAIRVAIKNAPTYDKQTFLRFFLDDEEIKVN